MKKDALVPHKNANFKKLRAISIALSFFGA